MCLTNNIFNNININWIPYRILLLFKKINFIINVTGNGLGLLLTDHPSVIRNENTELKNEFKL